MNVIDMSIYSQICSSLDCEHREIRLYVHNTSLFNYCQPEVTMIDRDRRTEESSMNLSVYRE